MSSAPLNWSKTENVCGRYGTPTIEIYLTTTESESKLVEYSLDYKPNCKNDFETISVAYLCYDDTLGQLDVVYKTFRLYLDNNTNSRKYEVDTDPRPDKTSMSNVNVVRPYYVDNNSPPCATLYFDDGAEAKQVRVRTSEVDTHRSLLFALDPFEHVTTLIYLRYQVYVNFNVLVNLADSQCIHLFEYILNGNDNFEFYAIMASIPNIFKKHNLQFPMYSKLLRNISYACIRLDFARVILTINALWDALDLLTWYHVIKFNKLETSFITNLMHTLDLKHDLRFSIILLDICNYQDIELQFIEKYKHRFSNDGYWRAICRRQFISDPLFQMIKNNIGSSDVLVEMCKNTNTFSFKVHMIKQILIEISHEPVTYLTQYKCAFIEKHKHIIPSLKSRKTSKTSKSAKTKQLNCDVSVLYEILNTKFYT